MRWLLLFLFLCTAGFGCTSSNSQLGSDQNSSKSDLKIEEYFPLAVGDRRIYQVKHVSGQVAQIELRITMKKGDRYTEQESSSGRKKKGGRIRSRISDIYEFDEFGLRGRKRYLLKYPLQRGTRWLSVIDPTRVEKYVIDGVNRQVRVLAGSYQNCIVVLSRDRRGSNKILENRFTFAPKIGLVRVETSMKMNGRRLPQWTIELMSYQRAASSK